MAVKNTIPMLVDIYKNRNTASKTYRCSTCPVPKADQRMMTK